MTVPSDPANIAAVRKAVEELAARGGLDARSVCETGLCLNEAMANVIRHAYHGATDRPIKVQADCHDGELLVTIRDWGDGVNPAELPQRPYEPLEPGGLGLICLQKMMSEVRYVPQGDGMLLMMKKRTASATASPGAAQPTERP
jgi:anti-sigma regulatory factor (Ser/Thr protein kinase)